MTQSATRPRRAEAQERLAGRGSRRAPIWYAFKHPLLHILAIIVAAFILVPIAFGVIGGFKDNGQLTTNPIGPPSPLVLSNYVDILLGDQFWRQLWNSTYIALATTLIVVGFSAMAAYIFARFAFRGREFLFTIFALGLMFPFAVAILPLYIVLRQVGLLDNPFGVILPQAAFGLPITIIILRSFFRTIPAEIEESAILDGCSRYGFFWRVLLPMARPSLAVVSVLAIVGSWNGFLLPLVIFNEPGLWTLPLGVQNFQQTQYSANTAAVLAYVTLSMVPALLFYAVAERQIVSGLAPGITRG